MLRTIGAALVLSTAMTIAACNAGPPMDPSTPRPIVRMSTTEEFVLSAFLNFPQFSVQLTDIGDSEKSYTTALNVPESECDAQGLRSVFWSDDSDYGGHAIYRGSIPCGPLP